MQYLITLILSVSVVFLVLKTLKKIEKILAIPILKYLSKLI